MVRKLEAFPNKISVCKILSYIIVHIVTGRINSYLEIAHKAVVLVSTTEVIDVNI